MIDIKLTKKGRQKTEQYIKELEAKRKDILDALLDTANDTNLPTAKDIEDEIAWDCTGLDYSEYMNNWVVTDNCDSDNPICLVVGEDFILMPQLGDYHRWEFSHDDEESENIVIVDGIKMPYFMTLSPEVSDDECMRVIVGGQSYYFG